MKIIKLFLLILLSMLLLQNKSVLASDVDETFKNVPSVQYLLSNANMGTKFYLAIPPNDTKTGQREEIIAIYISSFTDTKVTIRNEYFPFQRTKEVKAFQPTFFSSKKGDLSFAWEVDKSEQITTNCFSLIADDPIAVMVITSRETSTDSYLAIPTSAWGKKYLHMAYYDHNEGMPNNIRRGGGFIVVSAHDKTAVTITLRGTGKEVGQTVEKHKIGEVINITLDKGEAYMIRGDGSTDRGFDLTGTLIEATNPVGVISFHQRTMIPNQCPNGRDHLNEMLLPFQSWGTDFVTMEFDRKGQGDFFRVLAMEDNTLLTADQYSPGSGNLLPDGHIQITLKKGEFWEYLQSACGNNNRQVGVRGLTVWHASKPVQVMQYAYSYPWDGDRNWDPLMILVPPISQFQSSIIFHTPVETDFHTHKVTFFAIENPDDPQRKLLNSIKLDGKKLADIYPQFLYNRVPNTNIFWGRIEVESGTHYLTSETKLAGYITGFSGYNSYGNPILMGTNKTDQLDTLPPEFVYYDDNCGFYNYTIFEQRNAVNDPVPQLDQGIRTIYMIKEKSYNFNYQLVKPEKFIPEFGIDEQKITIQVNNLDSNAKAYFIITDRAGNTTIDSIIYIAPVLKQNPLVDFGKNRLNNQKEIKHFISNRGEIPFNINDIKLKKHETFKISIQDNISFPYTLLPGDSIEVKITYNPTKEVIDLDSLIITTDCKIYKSVLTGEGVAPKISVADWDVGSIEVGKKVCYEQVTGEGIRISNDGSDTLIIFGVSDITKPFSVENPRPNFPFQIAPGKIVYFESLCFEPLDTGSYSADLIFISNNIGGDSVCTLKGKAYVKVAVDDNISRINPLEISPNPIVNGVLNINLSGTENYNTTIEIYNNQGLKVLERNINQLNYVDNKISLEVSCLQSGLYLMKVKFGDGCFVTRKFIVLN